MFVMRYISFYMLMIKKYQLLEASLLFMKVDADKLVWKLIYCISDFLSPVPRSCGIDLACKIAASKIQQSLDVKHVKNNSPDTIQLDRIRPQINIDLSYSHPNWIWIRFYTKHEDIRFPTVKNSYNILKVSGRIFEVYIGKNLKDLFMILTLLDNDYNASIQFCSELKAFLYNPLVFLSNYVKFMWCYTMNRSVFDPQSAEDFESLALFTTNGLLFVKTNNLSSMPENTHGPLIACSGERPKIALSKFDSNKVYINEGSRALQSLNHPSDMGTRSNYIEIIGFVSLDDSFMDNII